MKKVLFVFVLLTLVLFVDIGRLWNKIRSSKTVEA